MPTIKYSYIFDEEIDRVFECFRNAQLNMDVVYNNLITNLKFHKGENFDQENSEFSFFLEKILLYKNDNRKCSEFTTL